MASLLYYEAINIWLFFVLKLNYLKNQVWGKNVQLKQVKKSKLSNENEGMQIKYNLWSNHF